MPNTFSKIKIRQAIDSAQNEANSIHTRCQAFSRWAKLSKDLYGEVSMQCRGQGKNFTEQNLIFNVGTTEEERKKLVTLLKRLSKESDDETEQVIVKKPSPQSRPARPPGAIGTVCGSDGNWHWTDGVNDLGVADVIEITEETFR